MSATAKRAARERNVRIDQARNDARNSVGTMSSNLSGRRRDMDEARSAGRESLGSRSEPVGSLSSSAMRRHDMSQAGQDSPRTLAHARKSLASNSDASSLRDVAHQESVPDRTPSVADRTPQRRTNRATTSKTDFSVDKDHKDHFIKVVVRVRPRIPKELKEVEGCEPQLDEKSIIIRDGRTEKIYAVDEVHDAREEGNSQLNFYNQVAKPFAAHSLQGFNVCIFAYGHTGTGKTFTMLGDGASHRHNDDSKCGILPRYIREIFSSHEEDAKRTFRYTCEYYEVYNETIRDLLTPIEDRKRTVIHVHPVHGVKVDGVEPNQVHSSSEALELVDFGNKMRAVASTTMNERSSRSHAIFTFKFQVQDADKKTPLRGQEAPGPQVHGSESTMTFVDLAGREDQEASLNQAAQFNEMCYINKSLFHLAHLITKLSESKQHNHDRGLADFRNSKLTLLLSQALIGNSRTLLIATLAPLQMFFEDSVSTLSFAQTVKRIQTKPVQNMKKKTAIVSELEAEIRALRQELKDAKSSSSDREQALQAAQTWISHYRRSWEEAKSTTQELATKRQRFSTLHGFHEMMPDTPKTGTSEGHVVPFFTKLCDDPALQGCCNYFLHKGILKVGSNDNECNIVLKGIGIHPFMCEVSYDFHKGAVEVQATPQRSLTPASRTNASGSPLARPRSPTEHYTSDGERIPRILINGQPLTSDRPSARMAHGDCIILGHSHAFRLVMVTPSQVQSAACADPSVLARSTVDSLDMATALAETMDDASSQFKETFLSDMHRICPLIDEANLITKDIWGAGGFSFQLHVLTDCFNYEDDVPELVICVMQNMSPINRFRAAVRAVMQSRKPGKSRRFSDMSQDSGESSQEPQMPITPSLPPTPAAPFHEDDWKNAKYLKRRDTAVAIGKFRHPLVHQMGLTDHMRVGKDTLLYVWALEKFLRRLKEMREIYQEGSDMEDEFLSTRDRLRQRPYLNPWREMNFADVKNLAEDYAGSSSSPRNKHGGSYSSDAASRTVSEVFSPIQEPAVVRNAFSTLDSIADLSVPKNKTQPYGAMVLRFPDVPWPAPEAFSEELQSCLGGLVVSRKLEHLDIQIIEDTQASSASLTQRADPGILVEVFGPDAEMEEFRKVPIFSRLVVMDYAVDGVEFKTTEAALRLENRRWNAALSPIPARAPPISGFHNAVLQEKPPANSSTPSIADDAIRTMRASAAGRRGGHYMPAPEAADSSQDHLMSASVLIPDLSENHSVPVSMPTEERGEENPVSMVAQIRDLVNELKAVATGHHMPSSDSELQDFAQKHIDELRTELATCREETGRMFVEQSRLSSLLGKFESVLTRLTPQDPKNLKPDRATTPSLVRTLSAEGGSLPRSPRSGVYRNGSNIHPPSSPRIVPAQAIMSSRRSLPSLVPSPRIHAAGPPRYAGERSRTPSPTPIVSPRSALVTMPFPVVGGAVSYLPRTSFPSASEPAQLSRTAWELLKQSPASGMSSPLPPAQRVISQPLESSYSSSMPSSVALAQGVAAGSVVVQSPLASPRTEVMPTAGSIKFSTPVVTTPRRPPPVAPSAPTELIAVVPAAMPDYELLATTSSGTEARRSSLFSKIDINHDGIITREELNSAVQSGVICEASASAPSSQQISASPPLQVGQRSPSWVMPGVSRTSSPTMPVEGRIVQAISEVHISTPRMTTSSPNLSVVGSTNGYLPARQVEGAVSLPLASVSKLPLASVIRS